MMKLSVIIPVYNAERTIIRALESCLDQTYLPLEIILVDDGSRDDTIAILLEWKEHYKGNVAVVIEKMEKNSGPSKARNRGWDLARGEYICFLDADDHFLSEKLEVIKNILEKHREIVILAHNHSIQYHSEEDTEIFYQLTANMILIKNRFATPAAAVRRDISERFDETMAYTEDHDLFLRVTEKYDQTWYLDKILTIIDRPVNSAGGQSSNLWKMRRGEIEMYRKYCERNGKILLFPFLSLFSVGKHLLKIIKG